MNPETFERRRGKVLAAAAQLFQTEEYSRVHMEDVAIAADIAKPTLYRYFPTKEALFMAALERTLGELQARVAALRAEPCSAEFRLRKTVALVHERVGALAPALRAIEGEGSGPSDRSRKALRRSMRGLSDELVSLIEEGAERGEFEAGDSELAALAIVGAVRMIAIARSGSGASAKRLSDFLLSGLAPRRTSDRSTGRIQHPFELG